MAWSALGAGTYCGHDGQFYPGLCNALSCPRNNDTYGNAGGLADNVGFVAGAEALIDLGEEGAGGRVDASRGGNADARVVRGSRALGLSNGKGAGEDSSVDAHDVGWGVKQRGIPGIKRSRKGGIGTE